MMGLKPQPLERHAQLTNTKMVSLLLQSINPKETDFVG